MVPVAQLVRASVCGTEGRGFEPHQAPPKKQKGFLNILRKPFFFGLSEVILISKIHLLNPRMLFFIKLKTTARGFYIFNTFDNKGHSATIIHK